MGRPSNSDERRAQIVDALRRVMGRQGYERATVAAVAREAGLAPGLVHYHFESKAEILHELVGELVARARARIAAREGRAGDAEGRLFAVLEALLGRGEDADPAAVACWTLIGGEAVKDADVRKLYAAWIGELHGLLRTRVVEACREAGRSADGANAMAAALLALVEGYFQLAAAVPAAVPVGSAAASAKRMAAGLVAAQTRRSP
jgi:TetR/AcrR family transcriptional regulator, transcriptional repressor of bet genes